MADDLLERVRASGTVVCLELPEQHEFGLDLRTYTTGPLFRGMKLIPPGRHFVVFGNGVDRCGAFVELGAGDVSVFRWDAKTELPSGQVSDEDRARVAAAVARMELDQGLGPYEAPTAAEWDGLTSHISAGVLRRAGIPHGTIAAPGGIGDEDEPASGMRSPAGALAPFFDGLPRVARFVQVDPCGKRADGSAATGGRSGAALTQFLLDRSEWLEQLLAREYADGAEASGEESDEDRLVGEHQLAFVLFMLISSLGALEHWKARATHVLNPTCDSART